MRKLGLWTGLVGLGSGAIFDGILLHRLLQWHHVSPHTALSPEAVLWDGLFDALSVGIVAVGLAGLWRIRDRLPATSGRCILGLFLMGFGLWHLAEGIAIHLITGLHRVRPDADIPLVWDLLWLVMFGIIPLAIGSVLRGAPER